MKKIININLSGRVIPIEDAAYESLQRYIESLRRYFAPEEGRDEIINDIESRIAELMNDKVRKGADAVTEADIAEIINAMGRVEDFQAADAAEPTAATVGGQTFSNTHTASTGSTGKRFRGRLFRNSSDKMLGGVCSGIASYMNVDPAIVRLLFAIITFGGFGFGFLIYILLWIILPAHDLEGFIGKRLFRNPEERVLGGVAGGLAAYFNREVWIVRLVFAGPLLLNILFGTLNIFGGSFHDNFGPDLFFGSFTGTFVLIYIVLWIVLPEARSPFERMEMRGEKVDVNSIKQNVQQNMSDLGTRAQAWGEEVKDAANQWSSRATEFANTRGKTFVTEFNQSGRNVGRGLGHIIGVLFKAFFLFVFGVLAFALFVVVIVFTAGGFAQPFNDFLLNGFWQRIFLWGTLIFFLAVPLMAIITWIVRRLMKVRSQNRYLGWTFGGLWTLGWISLVLFAASITKDFRNYDRVSQQVPLAQPAMNNMVVRVDEPGIRYSGTYAWINDDRDDSGWDLTEDSLRLSNVKLRVQKSADAYYHVTLLKFSRGQNRNEARARAERLIYSAASVDNALVLGSGFGISKAQKFRDQKIIVEIQVPVGRQIRFDQTIAEKLDFTSIRITENREWNGRNWDADWNGDYFNDWKPGINYTMTEGGLLVDATATPDPAENDIYEYRKNGNSLDSQIQELQRKKENQNNIINRKIEEQRQKVEQENQRLRELEERQNEAEDQNTGKVETQKSTMETTGIHTPIFSLLAG